ncbi:glycosyltransferase family 32 protein [Acidisoma sp.]|uniref:glycosyltransferase family 32 protein n=1 Tax=Acidisoma sp. TaxID=1872115 RepID=UPI003B004A54
MTKILRSLRLNEPPGFPLVSTITAGTSIPRIIHQTYHKAPWPTGFSENVAKLKDLNPQWDYRFYDDDAAETFIFTHYGKAVSQLYNRIGQNYGAAKADVFRYLLLYRLGGIYLDMKSTVDRPLEHVIRPDDVFLLSHWHNKPGEQYEDWGIHSELSAIGVTEFQQWHIICAPGHPFLKAVIEMVLRNIKCYTALYGYGKSATLRVTGPIPYTLAIAPLLSAHPHRLIDATVEGLRYSIFDNDRSESHRGILRSHYSQQELIPLAKVGFTNMVLLFLRKILRGPRRLGQRLAKLGSQQSSRA